MKAGMLLAKLVFMDFQILSECSTYIVYDSQFIGQNQFMFFVKKFYK